MISGMPARPSGFNSFDTYRCSSFPQEQQESGEKAVLNSSTLAYLRPGAKGWVAAQGSDSTASCRS